MPRLTSIRLTTLAVVIAVAIGPSAAHGGVGVGATDDYDGRDPFIRIAAHKGACALLTAADVAAVLGQSVTWSSDGAGGPDVQSACSYSTTDHTDIDLNLNGGRVEFEKLPSQLTGMTPLRGVGDAAYNGPKSTGGEGAGAQVFVLKGGTYFSITVQSGKSDANDAKAAAALARKVASRI
jgi:hypothetical protein